MPNRSFDDANVFHRGMRAFAATKVGVAVLRPTANRLDQIITEATAGRHSFLGIATGIPAVILTTTGAKSGEPRTVALYGIPQLRRHKAPGLVPQSRGQPTGNGVYRRRYLAGHRPNRHTARARRDLRERH